MFTGSTRKILLLFLAVIVLFLLFYGLLWQSIYRDASQMSSSPRLAVTPMQQRPFAETAQYLPLEAPVVKSIGETSGMYAVAVKDIQTKEQYALNEHRPFTAASLYKLWVMAATYELIAQGKLREQDILEEEVKEILEEFHIATENATRKEGKIRFTVENALAKMITVSDNEAAWLLTDRVGLGTMNRWLKEKGFHESSFGSEDTLPSTTAADAALFFEKLLNGELGDKKATDAMLALLKRQQLNNKLPKYLPKFTVIAHKTGELGAFSHDAGIVYYPKGEYIIVVLSEGNTRKIADERIAKISEAVYGYFEGR